MLDGFKPVKVKDIEPDWQVEILGRPMCCINNNPAPRGGDFHDVKLISPDAGSIAALEVDRNTLVEAKPPEPISEK